MRKCAGTKQFKLNSSMCLGCPDIIYCGQKNNVDAKEVQDAIAIMRAKHKKGAKARWENKPAKEKEH